MRKLLFYIRQYSLAGLIKLAVVVVMARINELFSQDIYESWQAFRFLQAKNDSSVKHGKRNRIAFVMNGETIHLILRRGSSDFAVFNQVFIAGEYEPLLFLAQEYKIDVRWVIDLGANIGLTTVFLRKRFARTSIISVEPHGPNFELLKINTETNRMEGIHLVQKGIWYRNIQLSISRDFSDGRDWAIAVGEGGGEQTVPGVTLGSLMEQHSVGIVDILKMDIEGAELHLFRNDAGLPTLLTDKVRMIAIELHGNTKDRYLITSKLIQCSFECFFFGETVFGVNRNLCG